MAGDKAKPAGPLRLKDLLPMIGVVLAGFGLVYARVWVREQRRLRHFEQDTRLRLEMNILDVVSERGVALHEARRLAEMRARRERLMEGAPPGMARELEERLPKVPEPHGAWGTSESVRRARDLHADLLRQSWDPAGLDADIRRSVRERLAAWPTRPPPELIESVLDEALDVTPGG